MICRPVARVLAAALLFGGCRTEPKTISREKFVAANVALRLVPDDAPHADSLRRAALRHSGVTAGQLRAYVRINGSHTSRLADAWEAINDSVKKKVSTDFTDSLRSGPRAQLDSAVRDKLRLPISESVSPSATPPPDAVRPPPPPPLDDEFGADEPRPRKKPGAPRVAVP